MKNTICEKLMWSAMTPAIFKYIAAHYRDTDASKVKKKSHKNFKDMLARTPDIGGFTKNPLRICVTGGIVWLAVYEAMDGAMSHEQFGEIISADLMGGVLYRAGTLAEGAEKCDFYVCKKDSKWDQERKCGRQSELQKQGGLGTWNM